MFPLLKLLEWKKLGEDGLDVWPEFLDPRQTETDPETSSTDADMTAQSGEDHQTRVLRLGPCLGHFPVEGDLDPPGVVRLSLDKCTLVLVVDTVLHISFSVSTSNISLPSNTSRQHDNFPTS